MVDWSWKSYVLGVVTVVVPLILSAFFGEAGKDLYAWVKSKLRPTEPEPVRVPSTFQPNDYSGDLFLWVKEENTAARLAEGYSYYRDPDDGAKRFMYHNPSQAHRDKTFYMWRPGENKTNDAA